MGERVLSSYSQICFLFTRFFTSKYFCPNWMCKEDIHKYIQRPVPQRHFHNALSVNREFFNFNKNKALSTTF